VASHVVSAASAAAPRSISRPIKGGIWCPDCSGIVLEAPAMKHLFLYAITAIVTLGSVPALAECAPSDKVYIDPRLVPQRPHPARETVINVLASHSLPESVKQQVLEDLRTQNDPIKMPMGNGYVLISPTNPCIQQFIPER
jgi:hypothetical protein